MYYIIIAAILILDQGVKKLITASMALSESIPVLGSFFQITYIQNRGAAFSLMEGFRVLLIALPILLMTAALIYLFRKRKSGHPMLLTSLAFIIGGGLGNVIDRVLFGYVVDYLDFGNFPVFNVADIFVCLGCGLLIIYIILIDGKVPEKERA